MTALLASRNWLLACRPRTLVAGASPVLVGMCLAPHPLSALALVFALLVQVGTNFANDYYDFVKGADRNRVGPPRAVASGWIAPEAMRRAAWGMLGAAAAVAVPLLAHVGWHLWPLGAAAIALALAYTAGPFPLAYVGLGELPCLLFFGPLACAGTALIGLGHWSSEALIYGLGPGFIAVALMVANNLRDEETDRAAGKKTLVVRFGRKFGLIEWGLCMAGAALVAPPLASLTCLLARPTLPATARAHLAYTCALCLSLLLWH